MKRIIAILLTFTLLLAFTACSQKTPGDNTGETDASDGPSGESSDYVPTTAPTAQGAALGIQLDTGMREKLDQMEYTIYCDLFYNENGAAYENQQFTKDGVFAVLEDAFNGKTRYYVWGYADNTKCCDYQWEFVMPEGTAVPEPGSYVTMTGTLTKSNEALDGYWFTDATLQVEESFAHAGYDFDMTTDSPTLTRVQIINMQNFTDQFSGKTLRVFGRALSMNSMQHPYYDQAWSMDFEYDGDTTFAIGDDILAEGTFTAEGNGSFLQADRLSKIV